MGVTGVGKSSFIKKMTKRDVGVGESLHSETSEVTAFPMKLDGRDIEILDTPGFDDTEKSDTETLQTILAWLKVSDKKDTLLSGIIYLHRITDDRMTGTMMTNLKIVKELCGEQAAKNITLVSTRWEEARTPQQKAKFVTRENEELKGRYWQLLLSLGAKTATYDGTERAGMDIIRTILQKNAPLETKAQEELRDPKASINSVGAARVIREKVNASSGKWEDQIAMLRDVLSNVLKDTLRQVSQDHEKHLARMEHHWEKERENLKNFSDSHTKVLMAKISDLEDRIQSSGRRCVLM